MSIFAAIIKGIDAMRLTPKLLTPMLLLALVAAGIALLGYSSVGKVINLAGNVAALEEQRYEAAEVRALSRAIQRDALNSIVEPAADKLTHSERVAKRSDELLRRADKLVAILGSDAAQRGMGNFLALTKTVVVEVKAVTAAALAGDEQQALTIFREKVRPAERAASMLTDSFIDDAAKRVEQALAAEKTEQTSVTWQLVLSAAIGILLSVVAGLYVMLILVIRPLRSLTSVTKDVAGGNLDVANPGVTRQDELGDLAQALEVFRRQAREKLALERAAREAEMEAATHRRAALQAMATTIETETRVAMERIGQRTQTLTDNADAMYNSADAVAGNSQSVAAAADQALHNSQTVAAASEELAASIVEISGQVSRASVVSRDASVLGVQAEQIIRSLDEAVGRIGDVVVVISDVAAQTNLLALNATIEAARAGEAGKGFAVVAGEVKNLANQTARSTEDITRQINEVQQVTRTAVQAVDAICRSVQQMEQVSASVAAAVEEQGAATGEISRNVAQAADAAREVAAKIALVSQEAATTGQRATQVRGTSADVSTSIADLRSMLVKIVRTSVQDVDRRASAREPVDIQAGFQTGGRRVALHLTNLSIDGAGADPVPGLTPGDNGILSIPGRPDTEASIIAADSTGVRLHFAPTAAATARRAG
ncbi:hypothetical protein GCM10011317_53090 [Niveispirillum cyanobacteriorum]|nr:hypothetical protein GCM10011317_53090 [Niveispirillum cyanobacteriorum]